MDEQIQLDVSGLIPEARHLALAVGQVFWKHTQPWFIGLACFGSAVKGGFIPGASDIDFHLYLEDGAFTSNDLLRLDLAIAIQADLCQIDPHPFRYIDGGAETGRLPEGHVGPIPGNYHLIAGQLPLPEATEEQLQAQARWSLAQLTPYPVFVSEALLHHGQGRGQFALTVRSLCQVVWPVLYQICCLLTGDALGVWRLPKPRVIELLPPDKPMGKVIREFQQAIWAYYPKETSVPDGLRVIESGIRFLEAVKSWASDDGLIVAR